MDVKFDRSEGNSNKPASTQIIDVELHEQIAHTSASDVSPWTFVEGANKKSTRKKTTSAFAIFFVADEINTDHPNNTVNYTTT
jgi:hypothetical protein